MLTCDGAPERLPRRQSAAVVIAANTDVRLLRCSDRGEYLLRDAWERRHVAGIFHQQRGLFDRWCGFRERGVRSQAGPGRQPRFRGAIARESYGAIVRRTRILAP